MYIFARLYLLGLVAERRWRRYDVPPPISFETTSKNKKQKVINSCTLWIPTHPLIKSWITEPLSYYSFHPSRHWKKAHNTQWREEIQFLSTIRTYFSCWIKICYRLYIYTPINRTLMCSGELPVIIKFENASLVLKTTLCDIVITGIFFFKKFNIPRSKKKN